MSGLMWCSLEEWQTTNTALSGTEGFISRCLLDAADLEYWVFELVSNSVAEISDGVSCLSEVRVVTVL